MFEGLFFLGVGTFFAVGYTQLFCVVPTLENALVVVVGGLIAYAGGRILID